MQTFTVKEADRLSTFPELFGTDTFRGAPLFAYAESLFYAGLDQMVSGYDGGYFKFVKISPVDETIDIVSVGFVPVITTCKHVEVETPFGARATLNFSAACLVVWLFVTEQIANSIQNETVTERLYKVIQDLKCFYSSFVDEEGKHLFTEDDCRAINALID